MRIQVLSITLLAAIVGVTAKDLYSNGAEVENEVDLFVNTDTSNRQIRSDLGNKPAKKKSKKKKSSKKGRPTKKPATKRPTLAPYPTTSSAPSPTSASNQGAINGGWSSWSEFTACSETCGDATKTRFRTCSNPPPSNGGKNCAGLEEEVSSCGLSPCKNPELSAEDFTECLSTQGNVDSSKNIHNVNYFLRGYNIMRGNPHQVSVSSVDPGFQEPIFSLCYDQGGKTPDGRYLQPDGTLITMCQSCSLSAVTKKISGMNSYRDSLSEKVKISGQYGSWPWWNHRFSGSADYKKVQSGIHQHSNLYTHSDASCCAYQIQTDTYTRPPFSQNFIDGILDLLLSNDEARYRKFIESFGTHYVKQADMGSLFGQESKISKQSWKRMLEEGLDIEWSASLSTIFVLGGYSKNTTLNYDQHAHTASRFNKFSSSRSLYTKGSHPPTNIDSNNALKEWVEEAKKYPAPISLELDSILNLFDFVPKSSPIYQNLKNTLYNYCGERSCDEILDGQWLPWLTTFGGQRSEPQACDGKDYVTWIQMACGSGPWWWDFGLYDLCFKCSTDTTQRCFAAPPSDPTWLGHEMVCPDNGFEKMRTFESIWESNHTVNVQAQCNDDTLPQDSFSFLFPISNFPWISCDEGQKISGFQVYTNDDDRITNIRFKCSQGLSTTAPAPGLCDVSRLYQQCMGEPALGNGDPVLLKIYFSKPQNIDVFVNGRFVVPNNLDFSKEKFALLPPDDIFIPSLSSQYNGENYYDPYQGLLYLLLTGEEPVDYKIQPALAIRLGGSFDIENFFEEDIIANMAELLRIDPVNFQLTDFFREANSYILKSFVCTIRPRPVDNLNEPENTTISYNDLDIAMAQLTTAFQDGSLGGALGLNLTSVEIQAHSLDDLPCGAAFQHGEHSEGECIFGSPEDFQNEFHTLV